MNKFEFQRVLNQTFETMRQITNSKGIEYARDEDQLANFKRGSEVGCSPLQTNMVFLSKHMDSIKSYVKGCHNALSAPSSEPIEGRIDDAILYLVLLKANMVEMGHIKMDLK